MTTAPYKARLQSILAFLFDPRTKQQELPHEDIIAFFAYILKPEVYVEPGLYQRSYFNRLVPYVSKYLIRISLL